MRAHIAVLIVTALSTPAASQGLDMARLRAAAEQGDPLAQARLGMAYLDGEGGLRADPAEGVAWIRKAAAQESPDGQFALGMVYQWGRGVARDEATAAAWFQKAAEQDHAVAQETLGEFYRDGRGVKKNDDAAVKWFRRAAEAGDAHAQYNLGIMYRNGRGVPADPIEAHKWILLGAARAMHPKAAEDFAAGRDKHALELTPAQAAEAQARARDWLVGFERRSAGGVVGGVPEGLVGGVVGGLPDAPPPPEPVRVGGNIREPKRLKHVLPVYPDIAKQARVQGVVILEVLVGPDGKVRKVDVLRSIPLLDAAAIEAVTQWEYTPTLLNGVPVPVIMTVTVGFTLT